jgi:ABC-type phosphate transport system auxiliary subunit
MTRSILRSDLLAVAVNSFSAGLFLMIGVNYLISGKGLGFVFAAPVVMFTAAAVIVARRSLNRL